MSAYLARHPLVDHAPTLADLQPWLTLFHRCCTQNDLATAVRVLVLPLAGRPLHHWLLEHEQLSLHLHLTDRLVRHAAAVALTIPERAFLVTAQADRLIYYLPPLPVPGELPKWELGARNAQQEPQPDEDTVLPTSEFRAPTLPAPPADVVAPPAEVTVAIGLYRLAYRLYADGDYPLPALACLHHLIDLSLHMRQEARLIAAAQWARQGITRSQTLALPPETAHFLYQLALIQNMLDADLAAHLSLLHLLRLPAPSAPAPLLYRAWRFLGFLYELHGDPLDAMVCYLKTVPPTEQPPRAESLPAYVSGVLAAFELSAGQDIVNQAFTRLHDPAWAPQPFPVTALPPYLDPPGDLGDAVDQGALF
jgi:hypothetical protein